MRIKCKFKFELGDKTHYDRRHDRRSPRCQFAFLLRRLLDMYQVPRNCNGRLFALFVDYMLMLYELILFYSGKLSPPWPFRCCSEHFEHGFGQVRQHSPLCDSAHLEFPNRWKGMMNILMKLVLHMADLILAIPHRSSGLYQSRRSRRCHKLRSKQHCIN